MSIQRSRLFVPALFLATALVALCACRGEKAEPSAGTGGPGGTQAAVRDDGSMVAPDFVLQDIKGDPVRLSDYEGSVRLVVFWTTWCAPCKEEIPMFNALQETYGPDGFKILAIAMDDGGLKVVKPFAEKYNVSYLNLIGTEEVAREFGGVVGYPTAFLIDRDGTIVESFVGPKPRKILEKKIVALLAQDATARM